MITEALTTAAVLAAAIVVPMLLVIHTRSDLRFLRSTSFIAVLFAAVIAATATVNLLSWPTLPVTGLTLPRDSVIDVVGYRLFPGERMVLMLDLPEGPRLYEFPWDKEKAQEMEKTTEEGRKLRISTFEGSEGGGGIRAPFAPITPGAITSEDPSVAGLPPKESPRSQSFTVTD